MHLGTQHPHTLHVGVLSLHIGLAHENLTLHVHQRTDGGSGHTMLSGTRLGDDARLAHLAGHQDLSDGIVDFVCSGMVEVFTLKIQLATVSFTQAAGVVKR